MEGTCGECGRKLPKPEPVREWKKVTVHIRGCEGSLIPTNWASWNLYRLDQAGCITYDEKGRLMIRQP